jgi:hypothetical protein
MICPAGGQPPAGLSAAGGLATRRALWVVLVTIIYLIYLSIYSFIYIIQTVPFCSMTHLACLLFKRGSWPESFINLLAKVRTTYIYYYLVMLISNIIFWHCAPDLGVYLKTDIVHVR